MSDTPARTWPRIGLRNLKTALSAALCALLYLLIGRNPTFACIGAIFGMGQNMDHSKLHGGNRLFGTIIGGYVQDGKIVRNCKVRLLRDNVVIHEGDLASLKRFKDDVKEVNSGYECGMSFEKYNDIKEGDQIEAFVMEEVPR